MIAWKLLLVPWFGRSPHTQNAVKCFIVNTTEDKVFDYGDILKPAGWNAPARNYKRGNVLEGNYLMNWTGPVYMS